MRDYIKTIRASRLTLWSDELEKILASVKRAKDVAGELGDAGLCSALETALARAVDLDQEIFEFSDSGSDSVPERGEG